MQNDRYAFPDVTVCFSENTGCDAYDSDGENFGEDCAISALNVSSFYYNLEAEDDRIWSATLSEVGQWYRAFSCKKRVEQKPVVGMYLIKHFKLIENRYVALAVDVHKYRNDGDDDKELIHLTFGWKGDNHGVRTSVNRNRCLLPGVSGVASSHDVGLFTIYVHLFSCVY